MSIRDAFENCLVELNKVQAPSLLLDDFVYLFNKAVQQYINIRYNLFETKQQLTDDLRVLLVTYKKDLRKDPQSGSFDGYPMDLPLDYMHMLNCICTFTQTKENKCGTSKTITKGANKMDTILQVGKDGINHNLVRQVIDALNARELIKLRVLENSPVTAREAAFQLAENTDSESVQVIGTRFVLYKRNKDKGQYDDLLK